MVDLEPNLFYYLSVRFLDWKDSLKISVRYMERTIAVEIENYLGSVEESLLQALEQIFKELSTYFFLFIQISI